MNPRNIEISAVNAVEEYIMRSSFMAPHISDTDKTPIWDGSIFLYSRKEDDKCKIQSVENFVGRISVQVKGKCVKVLPKRPAYQISVSSLNAYKKEGGVIFFVVYLVGESRYIHCAFLSAIDIKRYVAKAKGNSSISVHLEEAKPMSRDVQDIYFEFWDNCRRQTSFADSKVLSLEDALNSGKPINIISRKQSKEEVLQDIISSPKYLYSEIEYQNTKILYPIGDQKYHITPVRTMDKPVKVADKVFYDSYQISHIDDCLIINIGNSVELTFNLNGKSKFNYKKSETLLHKLLNEYEFLFAVIKHKYIEIGETNIEVDVKRRSVIDTIKGEYEYWKKVKKVLDLLHYSLEIDTSKFRKADFSNIDLLYDILIKKEEFEDNRALGPIVTVDILDYSVMLWADRQSNGNYILSDFFDLSKAKEITCVVDGQKQQTSIFSVLFNRFDSTKILNADYSILISTYEHLLKENPKIVDRCNNDMLMLLNQYDSAQNKIPHILDVAEMMSDWVCRNSSQDLIVNAINKYQIIRRKRQLDESEKDHLCTLLLSENIEDDQKAAIHILLGNNLIARKYIDNLPEDQKDIFKSFPIYNLL